MSTNWRREKKKLKIKTKKPLGSGSGGQIATTHRFCLQALLIWTLLYKWLNRVTAAMGKEEKQKKHSSKEDQICQPLYSSFYWSCPVYFQNPKPAVNMTVGVRWTLCKYTEDCLNTELVNHTAVHSEHRRVQTARVSRPTLQQSNLTQASNQQCLFANNQQV